jgi:hypothetical protein
MNTIRMNSSRFGTIGLLTVLATLFCMAVTVRAGQQSVESSCQDEIVQQFVAEAQNFGLEVDQRRVKVSANNDSTSATTAFDLDWGAERVAQGIDIGLSYLSSPQESRVPNGYYKLHLQGSGDTHQLSFIDKAGSAVASFPVDWERASGDRQTAARTIIIDVWNGWVIIREYPTRGWPDLIVMIDHRP